MGDIAVGVKYFTIPLDNFIKKEQNKAVDTVYAHHAPDVIVVCDAVRKV